MSEQAKKPVVVVEVRAGRADVLAYGDVEVLEFDWDVLKDGTLDDRSDAFKVALRIPDPGHRAAVVQSLALLTPPPDEEGGVP